MLKNNFSFRLALRYFGAEKSNKLVSFISTFSMMGVTLGVAALIVVMAVMRGFHVEFVSNIIGLNGDISVMKYDMENMSNYEKTVQTIKSLNDVNSVIPQISSKALAASPKDSTGVLIRGIAPKDLRHKPILLDNQIKGNIDDISNGFNVAIGKELAISLGIRQIGDELSIIIPSTISSVIGELPRKKTFRVAAIFSSGMYDYDSGTVLMSLESAQKIFSSKNQINLIEVHTKYRDNNQDIVKKIDNLVGNELYVGTWVQSNIQFLNALKTERVAMFTILTLIIIVAAFNIISSLFMLVSEKKKDIAILKTMGASKIQILFIFIINGLFIGLIGTIFGTLLGVFFAMNIEKIRQVLERFSGTNLFDAAIYYLYHLPSVVEFENVLFVSSLSIVLCLLATIYPSIKAASTDPVEVFRNE